MARQLRFEYPGAAYHVMARGNGGDNVFVTDDERKPPMSPVHTVDEIWRRRLQGYFDLPIKNTPDLKFKDPVRPLQTKRWK